MARASVDADDVPSILVSIQNTDEFVEVFVDELPDDVRDLLNLLRAELAPLDIWHRFAVEYYRQGNKDAFREILKEARVGFEFFEQKKLKGKEKEELNESRLKIINALAADLIYELIELRNDKDRFAAIKQEITSHFSSADK
jgi:RNA polymerase-associated protein CTR9